MDFNAYQDRARSTAIYPDEIAEAYLALKLNGEVGEVGDVVAHLGLITLLNAKAGTVAELVGKHYRDDNGLREALTSARKQAVIKELGDVLWYIANLAYEMNISLNYIAEENLKKLASRKERGVLQGSGDNR